MDNMIGFIFDKNKCVGCHACAVACHVENELQTGIHWRSIYSTSDVLPPKADRFHLSLACNHCEHPACVEACPTFAYTIDEETQAVKFQEAYCIGCRYCTWACPYGAPVFNEHKGTIEKCTFCIARLKEGKMPACSTNCPTGALGFGTLTDDSMSEYEVGFPVSELGPRIRFIQGRPRSELHIVPELPDERKGGHRVLSPPFLAPKIRMNTEWTLYVFTLLVPVLTGLFAGMLSGFLLIHPLLFSGLLAGTMMISVLHLGRKTRAIYALRNLKTSWLSREILSYGLFSVLSILSMTLLPTNGWIGIAGLVAALITLVIMDRVYCYFSYPIHSAGVLLTGLLWIALIMQEPLPLFFIIFIKTILYIWRKYSNWNNLQWHQKWISGLRITLLIIIPGMIFLWDTALVLELFFPLWIGECIDRWEFYTGQTIKSPDFELYRYHQQAIERSTEMDPYRR